MAFTLALLLACSAVIGSSLGLVSEPRIPDTFKINYGVAFVKEERTLFPSASTADLIFHAPAPTIPDHPTMDVTPGSPCKGGHISYGEYFRQRCSRLYDWHIKSLSSLSFQLRQISRFNVTLNALLDSHRIPISSKNKRGLFDFVGDISSSLFGTATKKQVNKLYEVVTKVNSGVLQTREKFNEMTDKVAKVINITNHDLMRHASSIAHNTAKVTALNRAIFNLANVVQNEYANTSKAINDLSAIISVFQDVVNPLQVLVAAHTSVRHQLSQWIEALQLMDRGYLDATIIPSDQLATALADLEAKLTSSRFLKTLLVFFVVDFVACLNVPSYHHPSHC